MEIVYCSKCGNMIPPGGVDEGKHLLVGGEVVCPKCYKSLAPAEHTGATVRGEQKVERPAQLVKPPSGFTRRPSTVKLSPALRRSDSRRVPVQPGARKNPTAALVGLGLGLAVAAAAVVLVVRGSGGGGGATGDAGVAEHALDVVCQGDGTVEVLPRQARYRAGSAVVLKAKAGTGSVFDGWQEGGVAQMGNPLTLVVRGDTMVTARFRRQGRPPAGGGTQTGAGGLLAHWTFDRFDGGTVPDDSGNGHAGKVTGEVKEVEGRLGKALQFGARGAWVEVPNAPTLEVGRDNSDFSVAFWLWLEKGPAAVGRHRALVRKGEQDGERTFALWLMPKSNQVYYRISTAGDSDAGGTSSAEVPPGQWTHVAYVKRGGSLSLHLNGKEDGSADLGSAVVSNGGPLRIGGGPSYPSADCRLDDLRIYGRALSEPDLLALAASKVPEDEVRSAAPAFRESDGLVVIEAENWHNREPSQDRLSTVQWREVTARPGFSGRCAMVTFPDTNRSYGGGAVAAPRLDYRVSFANAGRYRIWVRLFGPGAQSDSVHAGLDGQVASLRDMGLNVKWKKWDWVGDAGREPVTVEVKTPGVHTVNVWMREDGTFVDRIVLSAQAGYEPNGAGPAESPRVEEAAAPEPSAVPDGR